MTEQRHKTPNPKDSRADAGRRSAESGGEHVTLTVIPIRLMVKCPQCSEISDADLVETRECHECKYKWWIYANQIHCGYPEVQKE